MPGSATIISARLFNTVARNEWCRNSFPIYTEKPNVKTNTDASTIFHSPANTNDYKIPYFKIIDSNKTFIPFICAGVGRISNGSIIECLNKKNSLMEILITRS